MGNFVVIKKFTKTVITVPYYINMNGGKVFPIFKNLYIASVNTLFLDN